MTRRIEDKAKDYLLTKFQHATCAFRDKGTDDKGFDLWLDEQGRDPKKVELKAAESAYKRPSSLFERLIFNAEIEKQLFESGESVIARVFMGSTPPKVFIITNSIFSGGAELTAEARYVIRGKINYENSITELA
jgi:hypothetical protein